MRALLSHLSRHRIRRVSGYRVCGAAVRVREALPGAAPEAHSCHRRRHFRHRPDAFLHRRRVPLISGARRRGHVGSSQVSDCSKIMQKV